MEDPEMEAQASDSLTCMGWLDLAVEQLPLLLTDDPFEFLQVGQETGVVVHGDALCM